LKGAIYPKYSSKTAEFEIFNKMRIKYILKCLFVVESTPPTTRLTAVRTNGNFDEMALVTKLNTLQG